MLSRAPLLLEYTPSVKHFHKKAFYGSRKQRRRDILVKWKGSPTSEGQKEQGFGHPRDRATRYVNHFRKGEKLTDKKAPPRAEFTGPPSPRVRKKLAADVELRRTPLLLDHHNEPGG